LNNWHALAWSYQQILSDLRNFQTKSENFKPIIFVRKVRKNCLIGVLTWLSY
jgi:hypothetical protein